MSIKSLTTTDTLRTSLQRPKVSFSVEHSGPEEDMTLVKDVDPLPIVELKPFVQKVWRREKSFASTWERSPSVATVKSERSETSLATTANKTRETETSSTLTLETGPEDISVSPPPRTSHSLPSRLTERFLTFYVNAFDDFKSQKEHLNRFVGESGFKSKSRLHPVIDPKNKKQPEHSVNIIQGFITRDDRTKTTLHEISEGDSSSRIYSCSPKALGPEELRKQQQIRISGETFYQFRRASPQESSPVPSRVTNNSWHGSNVRHGSPASMLYQSKRSQKAKRTKTPLYDHLDRMGALPSLSINATGLKKRLPKKHEDAHSDDYVDYSENYDTEFKHNVGGIENSLVVLSKHGAPTKVERQISFELEKNLSRFRKLKDYSPFEINPSELAKYYPPPTFNMTQGEARIRQAMQSNTAKHHNRYSHQNRNVPGAFVGSSSFTGMHNNQFTHGILKKTFNEIEHIDSYDNLYGPYNKISNAPYTPDEEPDVPFDTPRSHIESRVSLKAADAHIPEPKGILKTHEGVQTLTQIVTDTETQTTRVPVPSLEKNVDNTADRSGDKCDSIENKHKNKKGESAEIKRVQMKASQDEPERMEASGRTFLTSDNVPQVGIVAS